MAVSVAGAVLGACGIPTDTKARDITGIDVQQDAAPSDADAADASPMRIYLTNNNRLAGVNRARGAGPEDAIKALLAGPTQTESKAGLGTSIPPGTELLAPPRRLGDGSLLIDVSRNLFAVDGEAQTKALAQIVFTAMDVDGVTGVRVTVEHEPHAWNTSDGRRSDGALTKFDFPVLNPTQIPDIIPPAQPAATTSAPAPTTATAPPPASTSAPSNG